MCHILVLESFQYFVLQTQFGQDSNEFRFRTQLLFITGKHIHSIPILGSNNVRGKSATLFL